MHKATTFVNVFLILEKDNEVLLYLRKNTGYEDGYYSLVSGHVEPKENATQALIREAKEEAGIIISNDNLFIKHVMHRRSDRDNIDLYMSCKNWEGTITNAEPHKCGELKFYSTTNLPNNTLPYIKNMIVNIHNNKIYSEYGWNVRA